MKTGSFRKATIKDAQTVTDVVQGAKAMIYPFYYPQEVVNFFAQLHCYEHVAKDIEQGLVFVLEINSEIVGTGSFLNNHITRVYVHPDFQGRGYGKAIVLELEKIIFERYEVISLDASLPACKFYEHMGYKTVRHDTWTCEHDVVLVYDIMEKERTGLRLRPYRCNDAVSIVKWSESEEAFYKWTAGIMGEYPLTVERLTEVTSGREDNEKYFPFTLIDENGVEGFFTLRQPGNDKDELRFGFVIVNPAIRGKGYGKQMLKLGLKFAFEIYGAERVGLGVFENNPSAYHCYKSIGFNETGDNESYQIGSEKWNCLNMEVLARDKYAILEPTTCRLRR